MFKTRIVGHVGQARLNAVDDKRDAVNLRIASNYSKPVFGSDGKRTGYEDATDWVSVAFYNEKGSFEKMMGTTFRPGNVLDIEVEIKERVRQVDGQNRSEIVLNGKQVKVVHWAPAEGAQAAPDDKAAPAQNNAPAQAQAQAQAPAQAPATTTMPDDFDDDIPF